MILSLIVAIGKNRELGARNRMLWRLPDEWEYFKQVTMGHHMIMGRKTFESIGRPLPGRTTIVVSSQQSLTLPKNCLLAHSLVEAVKMAQDRGEEECFLCGGGSLYEQGASLCQRFYITYVDYEGEAQVYFPDLSGLALKELSRKHHEQDGEHLYAFDMVLLER